MKSLHTVFWGVSALLLIGVVLIAGYKAWPVLFPKVAVTAKLDPNCDLRAGPCRITFPQGEAVSFEIQPHDIPVIAPLKLRVELEGLNPERVEVDFSGVDMNMGFNRPPLKEVAPGRYAGDGMLPVCVRDVMEWEAKILLYTERGLMVAPFRFSTFKPGLSPL